MPSLRLELLLAVLACATASAGEVTVLHEDAEGLRLLVEVDAGVTPGQGRIAARGLPRGAGPGAVDLPYIAELLAVPPGAKVSLSIRSEASSRIGRVTLPPADSLATTLPPGASVDLARSVPLGVLRGVPTQALTIYPWSYDVASGTVTVHTRLLVDVRFDGGGSTRPARARDAGADLHSALLNPPDHGGWTTPRPARRAAASDHDPTRPWVKIFVREDGVYRITPQWLAGLGLDLQGVDPGSLMMTHAGDPVHLLVTGAEDGAFDGDDELLFHGRYRRVPSPTGERDHESEYGPTDTYWLSWGGDEPGLRFLEQDAAPVNDYDERDWYLKATHFEIDRVFDQLAFAPDSLADRWFWQQEQPLKIPYSDRPASQTFVGDITGLWDEEAYDARVTIAIQGRTGEGFGEHHTIVKLNGETLEEAYWAGQVSRIIDAVVPSTLLKASRNRILLQGIADRIKFDELWFNWFRLEFRRRFHASPGFLDATVEAAPAGHRITVEGFADHDILLFDVDRGLFLSGGTVGVFADSLFDITFEDAPESTARYVLADRLSLRTPTGELDTPSDWRSGVHGADYVILSHPDLLEAAERFAAHRREVDGFSVAVVSSQDVYDEFSHGRFDRDAIADFVRHIYHEWQPRPAYLLILGDETWDYRGVYTGRRHQALVPTLYYLARRRGYSPSDFRLALVDGDDLLPDLSIGRLAVDSPAEALTTVDKLIAYDDDPPPGDWRGRSLFVANYHAKNEFSGPLDSMAVRYTEPIGLQSVRLYATDETPLPNALGKRFLEELNHGALIVNFSGHGAAGTMQFLFSTQFSEWDYLSQVRNGGRLPLVLALSCLNGLFTDPRTEGLSELFTELPDGGAIAFISATAISFTAQNSLLQEGLYSQLFAEGQTRFGPALDVAKIRLLAAHPSFVDVAQTMQLAGDPAQRLALSAGPDYDALVIDVAADPLVSGTTTRVTIVVRNNTRLGKQGPTVILVGRTSDGVVDTLLRQQRPPFAGLDSIVVDWPVDERGPYRLSLSVDGADVEASNNRLDLDVDILEAPVAVPFLPLEGTTQTDLTVRALTQVGADGESGDERTEFALSWEPFFAAPSTLLSPPVESVAGLATWTFAAAPQDAVPGAHLFWRTRVTRDGITSPWSAARSLRVAATPPDGEDGDWSQSAGALLNGLVESLRLAGDALVVAHEPPPFRPAEPTRDDGFTVLDLSGAGVLATDGVYLYAKRWFNDPSTVYAGTDHFARIGTGFGGTLRGAHYGVLADSTTPGISATYHSDGYLYSESGHLFEVERIDPATGRLDTVQVPDGLLDWKTGRVIGDEEKTPGQILHAMITSDGRQIYNVSMSSHLGTRVGWGVRVFDVDADGWRLAREFVVPPSETGFTYLWTDGIFADGERLYLIEFGGQRRIRAVDDTDGAFIDEWTSDQDVTRVISGQYDWTNDRVWLGDLWGSGLFRYRRATGPGAGTLISPVIGPASSWSSVHIDGDGVTVEVQADGGDGWQVVAEGGTAQTGTIDLSHLDALDVPRLRLVARVDTMSGSRLAGWRVLHTPASDLEVAAVDAGDSFVRVAVRNRGLATAAVATIDLLTRSGRRLATQPVAELAAGEIGVIRFEAPLDGPAEPLRVWVRPGSFDADPTNDLADVPHPIPLSGRLVFRTWPQRQLLTRGDAVGAGQAILVEAAGAGRLSVRVDGLLTEADTTWLEAAGERAVIRLQPGRRKVEARLSGVEATGSVITLDVVHRLTVRNALILPNPVGRDGAHFTCYLSRAARLTIDIYGLSGRRVRRLGPEPAATGFVSLSWDGRDESGGALAAGTYLYVVSARGDGETSSRRGILVMAP
jgi:hypothetical protein